MSAHTPGPWVAQMDPEYVTRCCVRTAGDGLFIADCEEGGLGEEDMEANAHLIAAAPDLLVALKTLVKQETFEQPKALVEAILAAHNAIRKAQPE